MEGLFQRGGRQPDGIQAAAGRHPSGSWAAPKRQLGGIQAAAGCVKEGVGVLSCRRRLFFLSWCGGSTCVGAAHGRGGTLRCRDALLWRWHPWCGRGTPGVEAAR
eukprot:169401-Chlamydomonas_euryale.AAC.1